MSKPAAHQNGTAPNGASRTTPKLATETIANAVRAAKVEQLVLGDSRAERVGATHQGEHDRKDQARARSARVARSFR